jgi:Tfp pilus assembly protein FimV
MSIRLDPRRLSALKLLAAEAGVRPGELVTSWVEERLDAARAGKSVAAAAAPAALAELSARVDELARRLDALAAAPPVPAAGPESDGRAPAPKRRGRPPKAAAASTPAPAPAGTSGSTPARVPLHEEIIAVISERGPLTASEIAQAIAERGRYAPPRSSRPLDAATVNSRVSNPAYRARFARDGRRIGLAGGS